MLFDISNNVACSGEELRKGHNWRNRGRRQLRVNGYKGEGQIHSVSVAGIYQLDINPSPAQRQASKNWRKAGHLIRRMNGAHLEDEWLPMGRSLVFIAPDSEVSTLWIKPVPWLNQPMVAVQQYLGPWEYRGVTFVSFGDRVDRLPGESGESPPTDTDLTEGWFPSVPGFGP